MILINIHLFHGTSSFIGHVKLVGMLLVAQKIYVLCTHISLTLKWSFETETNLTWIHLKIDLKIKFWETFDFKIQLVMYHIMAKICSEKCVTMWPHPCVNIVECTYTNLDDIAYYISPLYDIAYFI